MQIESPVTQDNCSASLGKPRDAEQLPWWQNLQSAAYSHWKFLLRKCVMFEHLLHTNMSYFCPYLCHIPKCNVAEPMLHIKIWYLCLHFFLNIWKCVMSFPVLLFSEFGQMHIKMFQKLMGSDSLVFKIWTSTYSSDDKWHLAFPLSNSRQ